MGDRAALKEMQSVALAGLLVGLLWQPPRPGAAVSPEEPGLRLLQAGAGGLVVAWDVPPVAISLLEDGTAAVTAPGYPQSGQPGAYQLPVTSTLIALPAGAVPHLQILELTESTRLLHAPVARVPQPSEPRADADEAGDPSAPELLVLEELGVVRGVRLARLTLHPVRLEGGRLHILRSLQAEVRWLPEKGPSPEPAAPDPLLALLRRQVLNPQDAVPAARPAAAAVLQPAGDDPPTAFVEVDAPGLYRATYEDAVGADIGFSGASTATLRLFQGSDEVPVAWEGDDDAYFEEGEALLFYAQPRFSRWTDVEAFRLVADVTPGQRMTTRSADPIGLPAGAPEVERVFEQNHLYTPDCFCGPLPAGRDGDRWVWQELSFPGGILAPATFSFPFQASSVNATRPTTLTLWLIGYTNPPPAPDHRVDVALNGAPLGRVEWSGKSAITATLPITAGVLHSGANTLVLTLLGIPGVTAEGMWVDAFGVRYARSGGVTDDALHVIGAAVPMSYTLTFVDGAGLQAYDVTDPLQPQQLVDLQVSGNSVTTGDPPGSGSRRYLILNAAGISSPLQVRPVAEPQGYGIAEGFTGADVLLITHPTLAGALTDLVDLRQSQGLSTAVFNVSWIYDAWGDGRPDPQAIRAFIAAAYASWTPRPTYVLLVGDGSFDPRAYKPTSLPTLIPPYFADVDPWAGETAADNRYVCVDGEDALPDLLLGRLPVQTVEEAQTVVDKIVGYESDPFPGGWNAGVMLVADDPDGAGDFPALAEAYTAPYVSDPFTVTRRYCAGVSSTASDCSFQDTTALHTALMSDWNRGALVVQFVGHSSWQQWAAERFFHLDDLAALHNGRRLPLVVGLTCYTAAFQRPEPTLDEELVVLDGGGAVAGWGPTGLGSYTGHELLSEGFFRAVFVDEVETVGQATLQGKLYLASFGLNPDLVDTYTLLGDPALRPDRMIVPWPHQVFLPLALRGG